MKRNKAIKIERFKIKDSFWSYYQDLIKNEVIPYQHSMLEDMIPDAHKSHAIENFRIAAGLTEGEYYGTIFQDSDVAKWIEACAYSLINSPDKKLEDIVDEVIDIIEKAQGDDGYLNTYFTVERPADRWKNLLEGHELYCAGHMIEAAVAYYEATGKNKLLNVMIKMADHIDRRFGKGKVRGYPGHPEIELALMRLYDVTHEKRYLKLCEYFVNERGTSPNVFAQEREYVDWVVWGADANDTEYSQNHAPVKQQSDAVGHAVRAVYLYTGIAALAQTTDDTELRDMCDRVWESISQRRMYITGGIGSTAIGEAFTKDYDLPNDTVYAETCASAGLTFFAKKMLESNPKSEYADVMEKALYNNVLAGMALDGKSFFYVNPLEVTPGISGEALTMKHVLPVRPKWFGCACCPPNVARLISSLSNYAWSQDDETIYSHLFIGGQADFSDTKGYKIKIETSFPDGDVIKYTAMPTQESKQTNLAIRMPGWSTKDKTSLSLNGETIDLDEIVQNGYAYIALDKNGETDIEFKVDMTPYRVYSNYKVHNNDGCAAVQRGPLVYCFEGVDNEDDVHALRIAASGDIAVSERIPELNNARSLLVPGYRVSMESDLYTNKAPKMEKCSMRAIPYYAWANRGLNQMKVWMPETCADESE